MRNHRLAIGNKERRRNTRVRPWLLWALFSAVLLALYPHVSEKVPNPTRDAVVADLHSLSLVAHAGGRPDVSFRPNSLEALEQSYKRGHRFFELDFTWASDGTLIAMHDWRDALELKEGEVLVSPTIDEICQWHRGRRSARIIIDAKSDRARAFGLIKRACGTRRMIPQAHNFLEYRAARELGFKAILVALYRVRNHPDYSWERFSDRRLVGIVVPVDALPSYNLSRLSSNTCLMTHTINDSATFEQLKAMDICAIYTDNLMPDTQQLINTPN